MRPREWPPARLGLPRLGLAMWRLLTPYRWHSKYYGHCASDVMRKVWCMRWGVCVELHAIPCKDLGSCGKPCTSLQAGRFYTRSGSPSRRYTHCFWEEHVCVHDGISVCAYVFAPHHMCTLRVMRPNTVGQIASLPSMPYNAPLSAMSDA